MENVPDKPDRIDRLIPERPTGLVVVITGDGKGKTTSALGMTVRAVGHGLRVGFIQFMKGDLYAGEWDGIKRLAPEVELVSTGKGFCGIQGNPYSKDEHRANAQYAIELARREMESGGWDILVLDEVNNAVKLGLVDLAQLTGLLDERPEKLHMILTGRNAHPEVIERAHTVSEVREIKHAYRVDIEPQPGIDY